MTASTPCLSRHVSGCGGADRKPRGGGGSGEVHTLNAPAWLTPSPKLKPKLPPPVIWDQLGSPWLSHASHDVNRTGTLWSRGHRACSAPLYCLLLLPKQEPGRHWPLESHVPSSPRNYSPPGPSAEFMYLPGKQPETGLHGQAAPASQAPSPPQEGLRSKLQPHPPGKASHRKPLIQLSC